METSFVWINQRNSPSLVSASVFNENMTLIKHVNITLKEHLNKLELVDAPKKENQSINLCHIVEYCL